MGWPILRGSGAELLPVYKCNDEWERSLISTLSHVSHRLSTAHVDASEMHFLHFNSLHHLLLYVTISACREEMYMVQVILVVVLLLTVDGEPLKRGYCKDTDGVIRKRPYLRPFSAFGPAPSPEYVQKRQDILRTGSCERQDWFFITRRVSPDVIIIRMRMENIIYPAYIVVLFCILTSWCSDGSYILHIALSSFEYVVASTHDSVHHSFTPESDVAYRL